MYNTDPVIICLFLSDFASCTRSHWNVTAVSLPIKNNYSMTKDRFTETIVIWPQLLQKNIFFDSFFFPSHKCCTQWNGTFWVMERYSSLELPKIRNCFPMSYDNEGLFLISRLFRRHVRLIPQPKWWWGGGGGGHLGQTQMKLQLTFNPELLTTHSNLKFLETFRPSI